MSLTRFTVDSDDDIEIEDDSDSEVEEVKTKKESLKRNFFFDDGEMRREPRRKNIEKDPHNDEEIADTNVAVDDSSNADYVRTMPHAEERALRALERHKNDDNDEQLTMGMDPEVEAEFFDTVLDSKINNVEAKDMTFAQLNLSRALLRAVEAAGYVSPTPVQAQVIPFALAGRDICASAATGSGKTAAFVLPFLERLLYRPKDTAEIRVLIVTPTRELATQIYEVLQRLSQFSDVTYGLICGGKKDLRSQEALLRQRPDIVVCTPGRIIDHLRNTQSVSIGELDVLVLDEADRLLELGFQSELEELLRHCPFNRQTMLFSATMTSKVEDLACLSLRKPVRIKTSGSISSVAPRLIQEFIKVRNEDEREAMLAALVCKSGFHTRCIIFFETKVAAHRFYLILKLFDVTVGELHGDMTQPLRDLSLRKFRDKVTEVLIATDVAARGIDVPGIRTIINAEMPRSANTYIHRVGRTARAGSGGRAITLISDSRRKIMREVLRGEGSTLSSDGGQVLSRAIPKSIIQSYMSKIANEEVKLLELSREEQMKSKLDEVQREVERAENMLVHENEIESRPARTWYQSVSQKKEIQVEVRAKVQEEMRLAKEDKSVSSSSTADKSSQLARKDEYFDESGKESKKKDHKLSRTKRRRMEALKDIDEDDGYSVAAVSKRSKKLANIKQTDLKDQLLTPDHKKQKKNTENDFKIRRPQFAVGGFDQDMHDWNGSEGKKLSKKKQAQRAEKEFTEFDPNKKLKKGGKPGKTSFKSKSKYNRRK